MERVRKSGREGRKEGMKGKGNGEGGKEGEWTQEEGRYPGRQGRAGRKAGLGRTGKRRRERGSGGKGAGVRSFPPMTAVLPPVLQRSGVHTRASLAQEAIWRQPQSQNQVAPLL